MPIDSLKKFLKQQKAMSFMLQAHGSHDNKIGNEIR